MAHWNSYLYSIIAGALLCAVVSRLFAESKRKKLIRMLCDARQHVSEEAFTWSN